MPAHLTRLVIRRILSNEPIVYRDCLHRRANACLQPRSQTVRRNGFAQSRSFFGLARESARKVKTADLAPGLASLVDLNHAQTGQRRPPHLKTICEAFNTLIKAKMDSRGAFTDVEAGHVLNTLRYLDEKRIGNQLTAEGAELPTKTTLQAALDVLGRAISPRSPTHLLLAEELFKFMDAQWAANAKETDSYNPMFKALSKTVVVMSVHGEPLRARDLLVEKYNKHSWDHSKEYGAAVPWATILGELYAQGNHAEEQQTLRIMEELAIPTGVVRKVNEKLLEIHANRNDLEATKKVYEEITKVPGGTLDITHMYGTMFSCCLQHNDMEWGQSLVRSMLETLEVFYSDPTNDRLTRAKAMWDALFLWAAGSGKGVDEVDRMINVMVRRTFVDERSVQPDVETINKLVGWCMARNEPYFAERYIALGLKWGIHPNADTYYLQVKYRLSGGDIDGARAAYKLLQGEDCSQGENSLAANKLIQAMCASRKYPFNAIMTLVDDLNERKADFEPATVSALSVLHLQHNELHDVIDLLQTHSFHFSAKERLEIADSLVAVVMDRKRASTTRAWDTYIIAHTIFAELPRETRTMMMQEFFDRGRADMACHVFAHMRELEDKASRATADTYVTALTGIAKFAAAPRVSSSSAAALMMEENDDDADVDADDERKSECRSLLDAVHNAMKLDLDLEPDTRLRNALMLAYTECGLPARAWGFWEDIVNSREGPSFNSIPIAFRTCERMPVEGERRAKELWARLRKMDIEISKEIQAAYVGALAGNQNIEGAQMVLLRSEKEFGWRPDAFLLGTLFNAAYGVTKQEEVERWIQAKYPTRWVELQRLGARKTDDGPRLFNIDRSLLP
ncbi:complex i intermediate-associated protein 84 protein [Diplodia corticola]|uniref:Complex i intermediate-associated protein 84 protein n=1 Tax=Diplodia corticola TaxID=236234 RepID=A0A1J9QQ30_9PEZI|nr:complex i intermediate-associated protein 84 protein [Diplodia corticola]OJD30561.1 complex i intermediate-associated protein 84 protein [Diplodia corticola]